MSQTIPRVETTPAANGLHMALDLGSKSWKLAFGFGGKIRHRSIEAKDYVRLESEVDKAKRQFHLEPEVEVSSCYEAGRDGFMVHRELQRRGIRNLVVDSASIERNRRARQVKTDRIDVQKLLLQLGRHLSGEPKVWSVVHVPSEEDEDARRLHRELGRLKKEKTQHSNRIGSLLALQGVLVPLKAKGFELALEHVRRPDGEPIAPNLRAEILRQYHRWQLVMAQVAELEKARLALLKQDASASVSKVRELMSLKGIGQNISWELVMEFFGWRQFKNRRQVGSLAGLTPTPWASDGTTREQGISKAGNPRIRSMMVEAGWLWLRYQPDSALSRWFERRFGHGSKRNRRVGIVALARKLLVALWHFVEHGMMPQGNIIMKPMLELSEQRSDA